MVERELRVALLRRKARGQWLRAAWMAGGITFFFLLLLGITANPSKGRTLFFCLYALACLGVVTRGFGLTADLFSEERRNGTLGLLVLTGLTPLEIFAYKLSGALLLTSYGLLGALPFFAIPFLAGGVSGIQFMCALVFLSNALLFCVAIGLLGSVLHREGGQAQMTALALAGVLNLVAPLVHWLNPSVVGIVRPDWLATSPAYAGYLVFTNLAGGSLQQFWTCSGITLGYSILALSAAAMILHRTWRESAELVQPAGNRWQFWTWIHFDQTRLWRLRRRLLEQNPFSWLATRSRGPVVAAYAWVGLGALICFVLWVAGDNPWQAARNGLVAAVVLHLGLNWILAYAGGKRLGEERQTGGFEVLLTTPIKSSEIIAGQHKGLIAQFKVVWLAVVVLDLALACGAFASGGWELSTGSFYLLAWASLELMWVAVHLEAASRAMWIGTWTGRPAYAALQAMRANSWALFWLWFIWQAGVGKYPQRHPVQLVVFSFFLVMGVAGAFGNRGTLREKLTKELRDIAAAPIPARGDKRFKSWNPQVIYPPGRCGYFDLTWPKPDITKLQSSKPGTRYYDG